MVYAFLFSLLCIAGCQGTSIFEYPKHDGKIRTNCSNISTAAEIYQNIRPTVVVIREGHEQCPSQLELMSEQLAQILNDEIRVCVVDKAQGILHDSKPGQIHIFAKNKTYEYFGSRSITRLVYFLKKINMPSLISIRSKKDKDVFELFPEDVKVVGYFLENSSELSTFESAANSILPLYTKFFYVTDKMLAKKFKLTQVGQIILIHPYENSYVVSPIVVPQTCAEILSFVEQNRYSIIKTITDENLHDSTLIDFNKILIAIFSDSNYKHNKDIDKQIKKILKNIIKQNPVYMKNINIIKVDSSILPSALLNFKNLTQNLTKLPEAFPSIVYINFKRNESKWMDLSCLETQDKATSKLVLAKINEWLEMIIKGEQYFIEQPQNQSIERNSPVELKCQVQEALGDCLWYHNDVPIGYNFPPSHYYSWKTQNATNDCSLIIHEFTPDRDEGEWRCDIIGQMHLISDTALLTTANNDVFGTIN